MKLPKKTNGQRISGTMWFISFSAIATLAILTYFANIGADNFLFFLAREIPFGDKIAHFIVYGGLSFILNLTTRSLFFTVAKTNIPYSAMAVVAFATLEELHQNTIEHRSASLADWLSGMIGIIAFTYLSNRFLR